MSSQSSRPLSLTRGQSADCDTRPGGCFSTRSARRIWPCKRRGMTMIMFALVFVLLISFLGLVIDGGYLLASHRRTQNAADAAAMAAAYDRLRGRSVADATATAQAFVSDNGLNGAAVTAHIPPASGPYAGDWGYVEVIVSHNVSTFLMHAVGMAPENAVVARAVAGYEATSAGEGVIVLDRTARPGLTAQGNGTIRVQGRIVVNSDGGGVDENGVTVGTGTVAASAGKDGSTYGIFAEEIQVVGGVDKPELFKHISQADGFGYIQPIQGSPLRCRQMEEPDPLINLPTPMTSTGVDPTKRGSVSVSDGTVQGLSGLNFQATGEETVPVGKDYYPPPDQVVLFPGVYDQLEITGGSVFLVPGIYVIAPQKNVSDALKITGGSVVAEGIMFYNTTRSYTPENGTPDINDGDKKDPLPNDEYAGGFTINAGMVFTPINTKEFDYPSWYTGAPQVSDKFDGMLFYQRRRNPNSLDIQGNAAEGQLQGTLYAKWSLFKISGQGTYDAQFVCGSMSVSGSGNVTILGAGDNWGKANAVFLVE